MNRIVPAIDILGGQVVRLYQGDYRQVTRYQKSPLELAYYFEECGYTRLHIVDLLGAKEGTFSVGIIVEDISSKTTLKVDCSGGIRTFASAQVCFNAGAEYICLGSLAVTHEASARKIIESYPYKVILGADCSGAKVQTHGWTVSSDLTLESLLLRYSSAPLYGTLVTDIQHDGTLQGANNALYKTLLSQFPSMRFIASGGVKSIEEGEQLLADGVYEVIIGKALYSQEGTDGR
jgi:phosphoribosylformimino-5-aminoimidazole carboxamide ribotide isomerase